MEIKDYLEKLIYFYEIGRKGNTSPCLFLVQDKSERRNVYVNLVNHKRHLLRQTLS